MKTEFIEQLTQNLQGEVRKDALTKIAYSVDASIYEIAPLVVVTPKDTEDLVKSLQIAYKHGISVTARGAATGITGGCLGQGMILDLSKYLNKILDMNIEEEYVICEPGVIQDQLNEALAPYGYRLGPDTSTGNRATIGGMLANNAAGARSLRFGKMVDHVESVEIAFADGSIDLLEEISVARLTSSHDSLSISPHLREIYGAAKKIRSHCRQEILERVPDIPRCVSGYNLQELIKPGALNLSKLMAGSEGSLGVATKIRLRICKKLGKTGVCLLHFHDIVEAMRCVPHILSYHPISLEMIDDKIIAMAKLSPSVKSKLEWLTGEPEVVLAVEFEDPCLQDKLQNFSQEMRRLAMSYSIAVLPSEEQIGHLWEVRKAGLGLLLSKRAYSRAIAFIEDLSIPPDRLADFMAEFKKYLKENHKDAGIYGHAGAGCLHIRPYIDLRKPEEQLLMQEMMLAISSMVLSYGGALSGEHGDGLIRSWLNKKMFGDKLYEAFCQLKQAFDPLNRMNPGKIVHAQSVLENLRTTPLPEPQIQTFQDFTKEGGLALATDLCNGNALCRKKEGLMCPSFQATGDEFDTTRARAQALRAVFNGQKKISDFSDPEIGKALDLCLECKGCKTQCPSQVDMTKMKMEYLYQHQEKYGYSFRNLLFGHISSLYSLAQPLAPIFNALSGSLLMQKMLPLFGITAERRFPKLADKRLSHYSIENRTDAANKVVLFNDTFTEFLQPEIGLAAHSFLSRLGFSVIIPAWSCCGRPLLSKGMLKEGRKKAEKLLDLLFPFAQEKIPIVGLEPSCILTIIDDFSAIVSPEYREKALAVSLQCQTLDQFLHSQRKLGSIELPIFKNYRRVAVHGHCHQKALIGMQTCLEFLHEIPNIQTTEIPSGCCGMAGSFGYEKEHYSISMNIGSLKLFPTIEASATDTIIIANGFSCRTQIEQGTARKAIHLAEFFNKYSE